MSRTRTPAQKARQAELAREYRRRAAQKRKTEKLAMIQKETREYRENMERLRIDEERCKLIYNLED